MQEIFLNGKQAREGVQTRKYSRPSIRYTTIVSNSKQDNVLSFLASLFLIRSFYSAIIPSLPTLVVKTLQGFLIEV